jgi:glutaminase
LFGKYTGREVAVDEAVYRSESATGHRNRAIGHLLRNFEIVDGDPEDALDLYFRTCAISVTCRDLAVAAASLANGGVNPITGKRAVETRYVSSILSVMGSCGMYDYAGEWIYRVGMPAKSGVSGDVLAVLPGQLGIGVFSPLLDERGNSVRGVRVCADVSRSYGLHMLSVPNLGGSAVRAAYDLNAVRSKRQRTPEAMAKIAASGSRVRIYEMQGDIIFASAEAFSRRVVGDIEEFDILAVDVKHVTRLGGDGSTILGALFGELLDAGKSVALSGTSEAIDAIASATQRNHGSQFAVLSDKDHALEWCEDRLLERAGYRSQAAAVGLPDNELLAGLDAQQVKSLESVGRTTSYAPGDVIVRAGDTGSSLFLILSGEVSVTIDTTGESVRVATLSSGMAFGEMPLLGKTRAARTLPPMVRCSVLSFPFGTWRR